MRPAESRRSQVLLLLRVPADRAGAARIRDAGRACVLDRSRRDGRLPPGRVPDGPGESTSTISLGRTDDDLADELFPDSASFGALPPGSALLLVMRGPNAGSRFRLDGDLTTAGRHPDSDIFLDDVTVSRRHAEFYRHGARFTVRDVGSLNGTYVNRERIEEAELTGGDEVQIGKFRLLFLTGQDLGPNPHRVRRPPRQGRPGLRMSEPKGRGAAWTEERGTSDEGKGSAPESRV